MDYRNAKVAKEAFNNPDKSRGFELLSTNPQLAQTLLFMSRAQRGLPLDGGSSDEALAIAEQYREERDGDSS